MKIIRMLKYTLIY